MAAYSTCYRRVRGTVEFVGVVVWWDITISNKRYMGNEEKTKCPTSAERINMYPTTFFRRDVGKIR